ncbi:MAG TPA: hypothetical protein VGY56_13735 [Verrucomicrobiae bacterium]|nr:hypothetical protein [Verrucomicrobiae bacterium]
MRLFLERNSDETLAVALGVPGRTITHCHGKGKVSKNLRKHSGVTGLVDEDPGSTETPTFVAYKEVSFGHGVRFKLDRKQNNRLIIVCPKLENWVIETAKAAGVKMERYKLSDHPNELHADVNYRLPNFQRLLADLLERKSPRLLHLKALLSE